MSLPVGTGAVIDVMDVVGIIACCELKRQSYGGVERDDQGLKVERLDISMVERVDVMTDGMVKI
jgi:hypothetical protein